MTRPVELREVGELIAAMDAAEQAVVDRMHLPRDKQEEVEDAYQPAERAAAQAAYASWDATVPKDWRERADRHQALQKWGAEVDRWERVLNPPPVPQHYVLPF